MTLFILGVITTLVILFMFGRLKLSSGRPAIERAINRKLSAGPYIVAVGGGTGLSTLLRGIKSFTRNITAVVAVTDEGGSSGRILLRELNFENRSTALPTISGLLL